MRSLPSCKSKICFLERPNWLSSSSPPTKSQAPSHFLVHLSILFSVSDDSGNLSKRQSVHNHRPKCHDTGTEIKTPNITPETTEAPLKSVKIQRNTTHVASWSVVVSSLRHRNPRFIIENICGLYNHVSHNQSVIALLCEGHEIEGMARLTTTTASNYSIMWSTDHRQEIVIF